MYFKRSVSLEIKEKCVETHEDPNCEVSAKVRRCGSARAESRWRHSGWKEEYYMTEDGGGDGRDGET